MNATPIEHPKTPVTPLDQEGETPGGLHWKLYRDQEGAEWVCATWGALSTWTRMVRR